MLDVLPSNLVPFFFPAARTPTSNPAEVFLTDVTSVSVITVTPNFFNVSSSARTTEEA